MRHSGICPAEPIQCSYRDMTGEQPANTTSLPIFWPFNSPTAKLSFSPIVWLSWSNEGLEKWHSNYWIRLSYDMKNYVDRGGYNRLVEKDTLSPGTSRFAVPFLSIFSNTDDILLDIENVFQIWSTSTGFEEVAGVWANQKKKNVLNE